jgi:uncharacterized protein (DUF1778 family)
MTTVNKQSERVSFRLSAELKQEIERAAAYLGQSLTEFSLSTLLQRARAVNEQHRVTQLTDRDRDAFLAMLDDTSSKPNKSLTAAAKKYKKLRG